MDQIMDAAPKLRSALASRKCARTISATFMYILRGELGKRGPANHPPPLTTLTFLKTAVQTFNYTTDF